MNVNDRDLTADELAALDRAMESVERLPRDAVDRVMRHMLRVGLYHQRTGDPAALRTAMESLPMTMRRSDDEQYAKQIRAARERTSTSVDVKTALAALRG
jgi:hypothetical protein